MFGLIRKRLYIDRSEPLTVHALHFYRLSGKRPAQMPNNEDDPVRLSLFAGSSSMQACCTVVQSSAAPSCCA